MRRYEIQAQVEKTRCVVVNGEDRCRRKVFVVTLCDPVVRIL